MPFTDMLLGIYHGRYNLVTCLHLLRCPSHPLRSLVNFRFAHQLSCQCRGCFHWCHPCSSIVRSKLWLDQYLYGTVPARLTQLPTPIKQSQLVDTSRRIYPHQFTYTTNHDSTNSLPNQVASRTFHVWDPGMLDYSRYDRSWWAGAVNRRIHRRSVIRYRIGRRKAVGGSCQHEVRRRSPWLEPLLVP